MKGKRPGEAVRLEGQVTLFSALLFMVVFSLLAAQYMSALYYVQRACGKRAARLSGESLLAAYNRPLREYYYILALDGGRGKAEFDAAGLEAELEWGFQRNVLGIPGAGIGEISVEDPVFTLFIDGDWEFFQREIGMNQREGLILDGIEALADQWKQRNLSAGGELKQQQAEVQEPAEETETADREHNGTGDPITDPREFVMEIWNQGILAAACPGDYALSEKECEMSAVSFPEPGMRWYRNLDLKDDGSISEVIGSWDELAAGDMDLGGIAGEAATGRYISEVFTHAAGNSEVPAHERVLDYEIEYILAGNESDRENLKNVLWKLIALRCAMNIGHITGDGEKRSQVDGTALILASALLVPQFTSVIGFLLKMTWAFAESLTDCRTLLRGGKVPMMKNRTNWYLSWDQMLHMEADLLDGNEGREGLSYGQYLQIFLMLTKRDTKYRRMTHLMEKNIRRIPGYENFYMANSVYGFQTVFDWKWDQGKKCRAAIGLSY